MNTKTNLQEKWLPVIGYENYYEVSDLGRVRSLPRTIKREDGIIRKNGSKLKKQTLNNVGYFLVNLTVNKKSRTELVHRIVAKAFIQNPKNKPQVNHKDAVKTNNKVSNLEWNTSYENTHHAIKNGLTKHHKGEEVHNSKISDEDAKFIKYKSPHLRNSELAEIFKMSRTNISAIRNGRAWKHI